MNSQRKSYARLTRAELREHFAAIGKGQHARGTTRPRDWQQRRKAARKCAARSRKINWRG